MKLRKACLLSFAAAAIASGGITEQTSAAPVPAASSVHQQSPSFKQIHPMLLDHRKNAPLMITAHRGQWRDYPENSLMAIDEAIRDGARKLWKSMCGSRLMVYLS